LTDNQRDGATSGFKAVVGCSASLFWSGAFIFGFPGVMAPQWKDQFNASQGALGSILFFVLAAVGIFMFFVGKWQERVGIRQTITVGAVITALNVLFLSFASNLYMIYAFAFIAGASSCLIYTPSLTCVQRWYPEKRGLVSGAVNVTFGLSAALMSPVFVLLIDTIGYSSMICLVGAVALVSGILSSRLTGTPPVNQTSLTSSGSSCPSANLIHFDKPLGLMEIISTRSFRLLWLSWALQGAAGISMVPLSTSYGISKSYSIESAVVILMAFNFASGVMRLLSGVVSDHLGRNVTMSICFLMSSLAYVGLAHSDSLLWMSVCAAFIGFAFGTLFTVSAPLVTDCFGIQNFGSVFGIVFTAYGFFSGPLGPALSGFVLDMTQDYRLVFYYLSLFSFVASLLILFVKPVAGRKRK
jgi:OFA family oxalate/formate antiporter-like MFS transporter